MITEKEYKAAEKRFSALFEKSYKTGISADEKQEYFRLQDILISYENNRMFWQNIRSGNYRTN